MPTLPTSPLVCALCGDGGGAPVYRDAVAGFANLFTLVRCGRCGLIRMDPAPTDEALEAYYQRYQEHMAAPGRRLLTDAEALARAQAAAADLERLRPPGRLLDIGAGGGHLLRAARSRGWEVFGVEASGAAIAALRREFGQERAWPATAVPPGAGPFDAVVMRHVLEHLRDPLGMLQQAREWLAPQGILLCEVPDVGALRIRLRRRPLMGQLHLWHFSASTLGRLLGRAGLRVVGMAFCDHRAPAATWRRALRRARLGVENAAWRGLRVDIGTNLRVYGGAAFDRCASAQ